MPDPRVACRADLSETGIRLVAVRIAELRMVKDVKELRAKFDRIALMNLYELAQGGVPIIKPRSKEEPPVRRSKGTQSLQ